MPSRDTPTLTDRLLAMSGNHESSRLSQQPDEIYYEASPRGGSLPLQEHLPQEGHKRVYQACIPCRRRKVRCDLGSVDNPHDPPCVRCRRESKECYFSATRRKRKIDDGDAAEASDYIIRNGRRKLHASSASVSLHEHSLFKESSLVAESTGIRLQPLRRPRPASCSSQSRREEPRACGSLSVADELNTPLENFEARSVMRQEVYGPHDALDLLYKAATDSPHEKLVGRISNQTLESAPNTFEKPCTLNPVTFDRHDIDSKVYYSSKRSNVLGSKDEQLAPTIAKHSSTDEPGYDNALQLWTRFRFVRAGWFTAQEAIEYIDYYYKYLSPLTPISPPTFNNPNSHTTLLNEEPILAVTLLTIASRYKTLSGPGAACRSHAIHEQLWTYLRGMIERVVWGQEAFGGGFCGSGADGSQTSSTAPWRGLRKGSLRTLGTIESLMILTEWHPRALHFPPAEVTDELLLPSSSVYESHVAETDRAIHQPMGVGGKRIESWLEPAWRSDRMCWMLLSTAMGLAYELGVFDDIGEMLTAGTITRPEYEEETYRLRAYRIKRLIHIYVTQLAGRLGWTNMVPEALRKDPASSRRRPSSAPDGQTPGTTPTTSSNTFNYIPDLELDDQIIHCWVGISNAMHVGNEKLFCSRKHTTDIIQSGSYIELLKEFQPLLRDWWKEFELFRLPTFIRHVLTIEYEYVRIYVNSLSLQAVVERCTNNAGHSGSVGVLPNNSAPQLSPQTQNYYGKLPLGQLGGFGVADQEYVREVVDGCRNLLRTVVDGLLPGGYLKHAPVRTYFRIISGAMFLLKTFALGASRVDVEVSITLMDRTVSALRNCVVDDVHLGTRFADLLESLTSRLRNRFIHAPNSMSAQDGRSPNFETCGPISNNHPSNLAQSLPSSSDYLPKSSFPTLDRSSTPANISAIPFDSAGGNFPAMPSLFSPSTPGAIACSDDVLADNTFGDGTDWNSNEMWYLPAGPAFFQNVGDSNVAMTAEGVRVAGMDLLDFMTMDPPPDVTHATTTNGM